MADPEEARRNQLRNIEARSGQPLAALQAAVVGSGLARHGERRSWAMAHLQLGYGDANALVLSLQPTAAVPADDQAAAVSVQPAAPAAAGQADPAVDDPSAALYPGAKAALRPLHDAVLQLVAGLGPYTQAPKKAYLSLRRSKQFAMLGPATRDSIEVGLNARGLAPHPRLKLLPPGGMCQASTRITRPDEVDATLEGWLRLAYDAAG